MSWKIFQSHGQNVKDGLKFIIVNVVVVVVVVGCRSHYGLDLSWEVELGWLFLVDFEWQLRRLWVDDEEEALIIIISWCYFLGSIDCIFLALWVQFSQNHKFFGVILKSKIAPRQQWWRWWDCVGFLIAKQMFSMPEAALGLHTDCGSSFWLSRLPGHLGRVSPPYIKTQHRNASLSLHGNYPSPLPFFIHKQFLFIIFFLQIPN